MADEIINALKNFKSDTQTQSKLEFKPRLGDNIQTLLNTQIKNELYSSHLYFAIAAWCSNGPWSNGYKLFRKYGQEERVHADKIMEYMDDKNCRFIIPDVLKPPADFKDMREILSKSLEHEIEVTSNWETISNAAKVAGDNTTYYIAQWFISEQQEEEIKFRELLYKYDLGMPDWAFENYLGEILG